MTPADTLCVKYLKSMVKKNPDFKFFIASKRGGNARGSGAERSVILGSDDGKEWFQACKIWGLNNNQRAREIIKAVKS